MDKIRQLSDLTLGELTEGVIKMCKDLRIAGSTATYNLYDAVQKEYMRDVVDNKRPTHMICGKKLSENSYHGAISSGAKWFCMTCNMHLDGDFVEIVLK